MTTGVIRRLPAALAELLVGVNLTGAASAGLAPLFDAELPDETAIQREARHHAAITVCTRCPVRRACDTARTDLGRDAAGVWAGVSSAGHHLTYRRAA